MFGDVLIIVLVLTHGPSDSGCRVINRPLVGGMGFVDGFLSLIFFFFLIFFLTFIYFWDRERQSMNGGGAEREGDTESETGSRL